MVTLRILLREKLQLCVDIDFVVVTVAVCADVVLILAGSWVLPPSRLLGVAGYRIATPPINSATRDGPCA